MDKLRDRVIEAKKKVKLYRQKKNQAKDEHERALEQ
jgi:hypothetical protein